MSEAPQNRNPANVQAVDYKRHGQLKVKPNPGFSHAKDRNLVGVNIAELGSCAACFPLVIIQNPQDQNYMLAAMLGLRAGENVYHGEEFWASSYVPLAIQRHPFVVGFDDRGTEQEQLTTCIDVDSPWVNTKEGLALYNKEDEESEFLRSRHQILRRLFDGERHTARFIQRIRELDLLGTLDIDLMQRGGEVRRISGLHTLDEVKLKNLTAEQLKELQDQDFLAPCYLILASLYQLNNMVRLRNRKGGEQLVNFRLVFNGKPAE